MTIRSLPYGLTVTKTAPRTYRVEINGYSLNYPLATANVFRACDLVREAVKLHDESAYVKALRHDGDLQVDELSRTHFRYLLDGVATRTAV